jgi:hypothetical protein
MMPSLYAARPTTGELVARERRRGLSGQRRSPVDDPRAMECDHRRASVQLRNFTETLEETVREPGGMNGRQLADEAVKRQPDLKADYV